MNQTNPLSEFITDETFELVKPFLDEIAIRDYAIRKKYKKLRFNGARVGDAIDTIREEYPYLQWETIRKITVAKPKVGYE